MRKKLFHLFLLILMLGLLVPQPVGAQAPKDPMGSGVANGLSIYQNPERRTAGLTWIVQAGTWPTFFTQGGVKASPHGRMMPLSPGIGLGSVVLPNEGSNGVTGESMDWAHNTLTYTTASSRSLEVTASRMSPGLLLSVPTNTVRLLTGSMDRYVVSNGTIVSQGAGPTYPRYMAYDSGGQVRTTALGRSATSLPALNGGWLLLWYGNNSHIVDTKRPLQVTDSDPDWSSLPVADAYQADIPVLLVFEQAPVSIRNLDEGGVEIAFGSAGGKISMTTLFGRNHPNRSVTEAWAGAFPSSVAQQAAWWANRLCQFPVRATETYGYDGATGLTTVTENITFQQVCASGTRFAPLPPMLAVAGSALGATFSGPVVNTGLNTAFGPMQGIENVSSYSWNIPGLGQYVDSYRSTLGGSAPAELVDELTALSNQMISGGHYTPWVFVDEVPHYNARGEIYWANPADSLQLMVEIAEALPAGNRAAFIDYIRSEKNAYSPDAVYNLSLTSGRSRGGYTFDTKSIIDSWNQIRPEAFLKSVPLYSAYALSRYHKLTGDPLTAASYANIQQALSRGASETDWASMYWFKGHDDRKVAVWNANRYFAGLVGFVRMSQLANDSGMNTISRGLLAKAAVMRVGMARFPRYLSESGLVELPADPAWHVKTTAGLWYGNFNNYNWSSGADDLRQVAVLNQFDLTLQDHSGFGSWAASMTSPHLISFKDMVPELSRLMADRASAEAGTVINRTAAMYPHWYASFAEGTLGAEHNLSHPIDAYQTFMARAQIEQADPTSLEQWIDIPWLAEADLFYMNKLAETIKRYQGISWSETKAVFVDARPGNQTLYVTWSPTFLLPGSATWQLQYRQQGAPSWSTISNLPASTRSYTISGLNNYQIYQLQVTAMQSGQPIVGGSKSALPTDRFIYLPVLNR